MVVGTVFLGGSVFGGGSVVSGSVVAGVVVAGVVVAGNVVVGSVDPNVAGIAARPRAHRHVDVDPRKQATAAVDHDISVRSRDERIDVRAAATGR